MRLVQISDTHFGTEQLPVAKALAALAHQLQPDLLVLSGDITQRARPGQFRAARAFMDSLDAPMLAIPGNHDIPLFNLWARWRTPYAHHAAAFGDDLPADGFDAAFVAESLDTLAQLATLTAQRVSALEVAFAGGPDGAERRNRRIAAQTLCGVAWSEGPDLISREHLEAAAARLEPEQRVALAEFVDHLAEVRLIGPRRRARLRRALSELL